MPPSTTSSSSPRPRTPSAIAPSTPLTDCLLNDFLRFVDGDRVMSTAWRVGRGRPWRTRARALRMLVSGVPGFEGDGAVGLVDGGAERARAVARSASSVAREPVGEKRARARRWSGRPRRWRSRVEAMARSASSVAREPVGEERVQARRRRGRGLERSASTSMAEQSGLVGGAVGLLGGAETKVYGRERDGRHGC